MHKQDSAKSEKSTASLLRRTANFVFDFSVPVHRIPFSNVFKAPVMSNVIIPRRLIPVAAISSEWWGSGADPQRGPGAEPLVRGSEGHSPPEAEKQLNFDNTKPL